MRWSLYHGSKTGSMTGAVLALAIATAATAGGNVHIVEQVGNTFVPEAISVAPGDTIRWIWTAGFHTVTSGTGCIPDDEFFNGPLGQNFPVFEYDVPGDFEGEILYFCIPHCGVGMLGQITVTDSVTCVEDLDGSGAVDFGDVLEILAAWGPCNDCPQDLDNSGAVDFGDVLAVLAAWGPCER